MPSTILHITSDYPGPFSPKHVTLAVRDSIRSLEPAIESSIIVPRRCRNPSKPRFQQYGKELHVSLFDPFPTYFGGTNILPWLKLADQLLCESPPDLVHSHKLSYEALIGDMLAQHWSVPHIITIRGSSDTHWRNNLPFTKAVYQGVLERSAHNLWLSMWAQELICRRNGYVVNEKDLPFPTGVPVEQLCRGVLVERPSERRLVCVARLDDYKQKGLLELIDGFRLANVTDPDLHLDIIGPAKPETRHLLAQTISRAKLTNSVRVKGSFPRADVLRTVAGYTGFILLSTKETFGLVFVEALLAGVPIVFLKNSGVDGYDFANRYGVRASSRHPENISQAISALCANADGLRKVLQADIRQGKLACLELKGMRTRYLEIITSAISSN